MSLKVFISQPMKGRKDNEILIERLKAVEHVEKLFGDVEPLESYFPDYAPETGSIPLKYLAKSIEMLADADIAYFCKGWQDARGCRIEHQCAIDYEIDVVMESDEV